MVKVRKLKSLSTQVPNVSRPKPPTNIKSDANLYIVLSDPLLSKKVSAAKEFDWGTTFWIVFFLDDENIVYFLWTYKVMEISIECEILRTSNMRARYKKEEGRSGTPERTMGFLWYSKKWNPKQTEQNNPPHILR